jgi:hypothetical protein
MTKGYAHRLIALLAFINSNVRLARGDCILSNPTFNEEIAGEGRTIPLPGSCCMADVCGLECPQTAPPPAPGTSDTVIDERRALHRPESRDPHTSPPIRWSIQGMASQLPFSSASPPCWA